MKKIKYIISALMLLVASAAAQAQVFDVAIDDNGSTVASKQNATNITIAYNNDNRPEVTVVSGASDADPATAVFSHAVKYVFTLTGVESINPGTDGDLPSGNFPSHAPRHTAVAPANISGPTLVLVKSDDSMLTYALTSSSSITLKLGSSGYIVNGTTAAAAADVTSVYFVEEHTYATAMDANGIQLCSVCGHQHGEAPQQVADAESPFNEYYAISKPGHLVWLRDFVTVSVKNGNTTTYPNANTKAYLVNDIDLASVCHAANAESNTAKVNWIPISGFEGTFDGNNKTISNLYYDDETATDDNIALFGHSNKGLCVKNLTVEGNINAPAQNNVALIAANYNNRQTGLGFNNCKTRGSVKGKSQVGGVVGNISYYGDNSYVSHVDYCTNEATVTAEYYVGGIAGWANADIDHCENSGAVTATTARAREGTGGIAGYIDGSGTTRSVTNCKNTAAITSAGADVGGVVGYAGASLASCTNEGTVTSTYTRTGSYSVSSYVGGVMGRQIYYGSEEYVSGCHNTGNVTATGAYMGGIAGCSQAHFQTCTNSGAVLSCDKGDFIGGIVGSAPHANYETYVKGCSNTGAVTAHDGGYVGGVVGYNGGDITGCNNEANVSGTGQYVGGIVGMQDYYKGSMVLLSGCDNKGNVTSTGGGYVGGIAGFSYGKTISNLTNSGTVTVTGAGDFVGGVVGYCTTTSQVNSITGCTNTGASVSSTGTHVGGVVGMFSGTIQGCKNSANVSTTGNYSSSYVGGIAGYLNNHSNFGSDYHKATFCRNTGNVTAHGGYIGGVIGYSYAQTLDSLYNSGSVRSTVEGDYVGGIVGYASERSWSSNLSRCVNEGDSVRANGSYVGGIVGENYGNLSHCYNRAHVVTTSNNSYSYAGGIAGYNDSNSGPKTIKYCRNTGNITAHGGDIGGIAGYSYAQTLDSLYNSGSVRSTVEGDYVGGIVGYAYEYQSWSSNLSRCVNEGDSVRANGSYVGGIVGENYGNLNYCYNRAHVVTTAKKYGDYSYAGGIAGYNDSNSGPNTISYCRNTGNITAPGGDIGGIAGYSYAQTLDSLYNSGSVRSTVEGDYVGGIVGYASEDGWSSNLSRCVNEGDSVRAKGVYVGGIVGENYGDLNYCYNRAHVVTTAKKYGGYSYAGGIAGYNCNKSASVLCAVEDCRNTGNITAPGGDIGGIVGYGYSKIKKCNNTGSIVATDYAEYIGGLVGMLNNTSYSPYIETSYNIGSITVGAGRYVGGLTGYAYSCHLTNSYSIGQIQTGGSVSYTGSLVGFICGLDDSSMPVVLYAHAEAQQQPIGGTSSDYSAKMNIQRLTAQQFANGEATWLLNGESDASPTWYQMIGRDAYPHFNADEHAIVHHDATTYYNNKEVIGSYEIVDAEAYTNIIPYTVTSLTYKRTFSDAQVDKYQALYVPFAMSYNDWSEKADVYSLLNIFEEDTDNDGNINEWVLKIVKLKAGESTKANTPYIIKPKAEGNMEITLQNATLAAAEEKSIWCASTDYKFVFTGTYAQKAITADKEFFMSTTGALQYAASDCTLNPQRWYMGIYNKETDALVAPSTFNPQASPSKAIVISCDDEDVTGIDEVSGFKSQVSGKFIENGKVVIIRNGKKYNLNGQVIK